MSNNHIQLTVKSVMFFAMQKPRPFLRQLMWALDVQNVQRLAVLTLQGVEIKMKNYFLAMILIIATMSVSVANAEVKWTGFEKGDELYTRGCSKEKKKSWIYKMTVIKVDGKGVAWGTSEMATIINQNFDSLFFPGQISDKLTNRNISKICVSGGCYTLEKEVVADVKRWMTSGCP